MRKNRRLVPSWTDLKWRGGLVSGCAHLGDGSRFVIPSNQLDSVWVPKFETRKQRDGLDAEQSSVHIIAFVVTWRSQLVARNRLDGGLVQLAQE